MPLQSLVTYHPPVAVRLDSKTIEEDAIALLKDVRQSIAFFDFSLEDKPLAEILAMVEKGRYERVNGINRPTDVVDFSSISGFFRDWRRFSERGCDSCKHYDFVKPLQDETVVYCGKFEDVNEVLRIYHNTDKSESPRIAQYREKGCDKIARCLRKLDEVLKDAG